MDKINKLNSIEVFLQVARQQSFSEAATQLGISKAMVSKHVTNLENALGVRLMNRTTRQINLTEAGIAYRDRVQEILHEISETEQSIAQLGSEPRGTLRVMAPTSFGSFHLARAVSGYRKLYEGVSVELVLTEREPDIIEEGLDMVVRVGLLEDSSLVARHIADARMIVCASQEYLDEHGTPGTIEELREHNCLVYSGRQPLGEWRFSVNGKVKKLKVSGDVRSNVGDALRIAAIQGSGLVQLPAYMVGLDVGAGRLVPVLGQYGPPARPIHAIYPHRRHLSAKVRTFVEYLIELYQPEPYWEHWTNS